ncbi:MAG: sterol desaturase family protein [Paracoccaceae bacterium]
MDAGIRLGIFLGVFVAVALWERSAPRRRRIESTGRRWSTNWGMSILDTAMVRIVFGAAAVGAALDAEAHGIGFFYATDWPLWLEFLLVLVIFDFAIWLQHVASHKIPLLWRLHRVHHADRDLDVSSGIRFHPLEIAVSMSLKIGLVYALGAPVWAVIVFEAILSSAALFTHGNLRLPGRLDRALRWVVVTPDMHRVHHSVHRVEHDTNYGFNLAIWDRIFGTYTAEPAGGQEGMTLGLAEHQDTGPSRLLWSLALPFRRR